MSSTLNERRSKKLPNRNRCNTGFSLVEMVIVILMFSMMLIIFGATFPMSIKGGGASSSYSQAALLAQHKIDQLRQAGFSVLQDAAALRQLGIIDTGLNTDGSYSFTTVDNLSDTATTKGYFGYAGGKALGTGKIVIGPALSTQGSNAPNTLRALQATVTIAWSGSGQHTGSCTMHTVVAAP